MVLLVDTFLHKHGECNVNVSCFINFLKPSHPFAAFLIAFGFLWFSIGCMNQKFGMRCVFDLSDRHLDDTRGQVHDEYSHVTCLQVYLSVCWTYVYYMYGCSSKIYSIQSACSGEKHIV